MSKHVLPQDDALELLKQTLEKNHAFLKIMHAYMTKSELPPPKKLTGEILSIQLDMVETVGALLDVELVKRGIPQGPSTLSEEQVNESAQKRLRKVVEE